MKAANYRYLEFISSFDDHSNGSRNLAKATSPVVENERSYRRFNFFAERDLQVSEVISRGAINDIRGAMERYPSIPGGY